ncbi:hypothetical protein L0128_04605 [candidate division KSB1 bacterium]|nr:hypothetical protein [candidate division KSB1 bacterium]
MTEILIKNGNPKVIPLLKTAIHNELKLIGASIDQAKKKVHALEQKYHLSSVEFIRKIREQQLIADNVDFDNWLSEIKLMNRLQEEYNELKTVVVKKAPLTKDEKKQE